jgi:hypothetical protein
MANALNPNIALIDQEAHRLGIPLSEPATNKRILSLPVGNGIIPEGVDYELSPNGQLILCKTYRGQPGSKYLYSTDTLEVDSILTLMQSLSGTR